MPGQFRPRGVTMRDCLKNRAGFDRVLMAVAATFLTVSATSAFAQADPASSSAAELAIDAAIPRPEPANVPPPTVNDFKLDTTASAPDAANDREDAGDQTVRCRHRSGPDVSKADNAKNDTATAAPETTAPQRPLPHALRRPRNGHAGRRTRQGAGQGCQQRRAGGSAGRRQTARNAGREIVALFRPQGRAGRGRKVLHRARICAAVDAGRRADRERQGRHRAPQGCRLRRPECGRLSGAGFRRRDHAGRARGSRPETDRQHAGLCAPGAERPDALVAGQRRHPVSRSSDRSGRSAGECHDRQGCVRGARGLQSAAKALSRIEGEARRIARPGRWPGGSDRRKGRRSNSPRHAARSSPRS